MFIFLFWEWVLRHVEFYVLILKSQSIRFAQKNSFVFILLYSNQIAQLKKLLPVWMLYGR